MDVGMRTLGGLLQLVGVGTVAYELHAAIARYRGEPNALERLVRQLRRLWSWLVSQYRRWRGDVSGGVSGTFQPMSMKIEAQVTQPTVTVGPQSYKSFDSDAERLVYLFRRLEGAFFRLERAEARVAETAERCRQRHDELKGQVQETTEQITKTAQTIEAGSVRLRTFGFVCVLSGIIYATWSPELTGSLWGTAVLPVVTLSGWSFAWTRRPAGT